MNGFEDDEPAGECDEACFIVCGFLAAERDASEAFEFAESLFDAGAGAIEPSSEEGRLRLGVDFERSHRSDAAALAAGCDDYHPKPVDFSRLLMQIDEQLARTVSA